MQWVCWNIECIGEQHKLCLGELVVLENLVFQLGNGSSKIPVYFDHFYQENICQGQVCPLS
jgi:hypothetical protein